MSTEQSWQKEFGQSFKSSKDLSNFLEMDVKISDYPIFIPKQFAKKIKRDGVGSPLWNQFIPSPQENSEQGLIDPIGDQIHQKGGGIIHRYKSRILFSPTEICPINCRYCFRKNELQQNLDTFKASLNDLSEYLENHSEISEVILTGGDPLILSDSKIESILNTISNFKHIRFVRFHSRTPVILPQRLTESLHAVLSSFKDQFDTITIAIHINHKTEFSEQLIENLKPFQDFNLISQSVLLKNVNDNTQSLIDLFLELNKHKIKPYYLHHPDQVRGAMHFYLPIKEGRILYGELREHLPGWLIPHYVVDSSDGTGKKLAYNSESLDYSGQMLDRFGQTHSFSIE